MTTPNNTGPTPPFVDSENRDESPNLFLTGVRIIRTEGENAARLWYATLTPDQQKEFDGQTRAAATAAVAAFVPVTKAINEAKQAVLAAWQPFSERLKATLTKKQKSES